MVGLEMIVHQGIRLTNHHSQRLAWTHHKHVCVSAQSPSEDQSNASNKKKKKSKSKAKKAPAVQATDDVKDELPTAAEQPAGSIADLD